MPVTSLNHPDDPIPDKPAEPPAVTKPRAVMPEKVIEEPAAMPKPAAKKQKQGGVMPAHHQHAASAGASASGGGGGESKRGKMVPAAGAAARSKNFLQVMTELDEYFLRAYESAHDVSSMLEATRMHYHSNFADERGHVDHSARVMRVITWNRSLKGIPHTDEHNDDFNSDDSETHATILDKMLAWEKKLYDEVKAGELMKIDYQRKVALLNKQKKRGVRDESLEKIKSAVSHLHTRYIVDMQSMDSTVSEINHLRDDRLYPKLVELVGGMATMWETMYVQHSKQLKAVGDLRALDMIVTPKETTEQHHEQTIQLWEVLREWHSQFEKLMKYQKGYIGALNSWLKLNLVPIESSLKEKVSSPPRLVQPPIHILLHAWHDQMEKLPDALAGGAISSFSEVVHTIVIHQEEELKHRERCEKTRREYLRESMSFDEWYDKHRQKAEKRAASLSTEAADQPERAEGAEVIDPVEERRVAVEAVKVRLESEVEQHQRMCKQVREKSLGSLKTHLPELFRSMSEFALATSNMYKKLRPISEKSDE